jgi:Holliday junction resolvasome RuvABC endonuclease subunit
MKILALDIATKTGWRTETSSGVWDFNKLKRGDSYGLRLIRFKSSIREILDLEKIDIVVYERPAGMFKSSIIVASEMIGVLIALCEERGIQYTAYSATEIKKFATGKGNAKKQDMIDSAVELGFNVIDDNHADAIHLYNLAKKDLE